MFYTKNLPVWERAVRLLGAVGMASCAWHFRDGPGLYVFGVGAVVAALTSIVGFCPACVLAGRKLDARTSRNA